MEIQTMTSAADAIICLHCATAFVDSRQIYVHLFLLLFVFHLKIKCCFP